MAQKAEAVHPVIDRDYDYASPCYPLSVELHFLGIALLEPSAEEPYENRKLFIGRFCRSPDVEIETVFIHLYIKIDVPFP